MVPTNNLGTPLQQQLQVLQCHTMFTQQCLGFNSAHHVFGNKGDASQWSQSLCTGSTCTAMDKQSRFHEKLEEENGDDSEATKEIRNLSNMFQLRLCRVGFTSR
ncbi:hypothetical protein MTR_3g461510 [Medicago truncatula]|uniref:Uncharacterized protein n=1 Tax=Medicago truncatula TaxID=3880 RepID=A0A072UWX2_MEDTR|nr:hypothetical protein MTR_3g461510 [Medicago truncatula]